MVDPRSMCLPSRSVTTITMRAGKIHIGTVKNGVTTTTTTRCAASGMSMAGTKSGASGNMIGAGNTTVLGKKE